MKALSGGERNRLLLARLFTRPANVLVLDEPTNDLDLETLELLEARLVEWPGTLLLVSHDRTLPRQRRDQHDRVRRERQRRRNMSAATRIGCVSVRPTPPSLYRRLPILLLREALAPRPGASCRSKEQRELDTLPAQITQLETEQQALLARSADTSFYKEDAEAIRAVLARLDALEALLEAAYTRWHDLDSA